MSKPRRATTASDSLQPSRAFATTLSTKGKTAYKNTTPNDNEEVTGYSYLQTVADNKNQMANRRHRQRATTIPKTGTARSRPLPRHRPEQFHHQLSHQGRRCYPRRANLWKRCSLPQRENHRQPCKRPCPESTPDLPATGHSIKPRQSHALLRPFLRSRATFLPLCLSQHPLPLMPPHTQPQKTIDKQVCLL
jgi:hypothetical protein